MPKIKNKWGTLTITEQTTGNVMLEIDQDVPQKYARVFVNPERVIELLEKGNPICPKCKKWGLRKTGKGIPRNPLYKCRNCGFSCYKSQTNKPLDRMSIYEEEMTADDLPHTKDIEVIIWKSNDKEIARFVKC